MYWFYVPIALVGMVFVWRYFRPDRPPKPVAASLDLLSLTLFVLSLGAPKDSYYIPALSKGAEHVKVEYKLDPQLPKLSIPIEIRKR